MIAVACKDGSVVDVFVVDDYEEFAKTNPLLIASYDGVVVLKADDPQRPSVGWTVEMANDGSPVFSRPKEQLPPE